MSYRQGTISVTNASKAVVGTGTLFKTVGVTAGDQLTLVDANGLPTGSMYEVASVTDNTHLTLLQNYQGTTGSGKAYAIIDMAGDSTVPNFARRLAEFYADIANGASPTVAGLVKLYAALGTNTDGSLTQAALQTLFNGKLSTAGGTITGELVRDGVVVKASSNSQAIIFRGGLTSNENPFIELYGKEHNDFPGRVLIRAKTDEGQSYLTLDSDNKLALNDIAIIESGTNDNGQYVKFYDGTMLCLGNFSRTYNFVASGSVYTTEVTSLGVLYPATFNTTNQDVKIFASATGSAASSIYLIKGSNTQISNLMLLRSISTTNAVKISYVAIGRWKE